MKRTTILLGLAVVLAGAVSCNHSPEDVKAKLRRTSKAEPVTVKVMRAGVTDNSGTTGYVGTVEAAKSSTITASASGTLTELNVREGQKVKKGQVIAKIESQSVKSAYSMAKATYEQAKDGMERLEKVYESGSVSEVRMVEMRTDLSKAKASRDAAKSALDNCTMKAPFDGTVERVSANVGEEVTLSAPLVHLVDPKSCEIHFPIPENEITGIRVGDKVRVSIPALEKEITAQVGAKGLVASSLSHSYDCTLTKLSDASDLMPGMVCKIYFETIKSVDIVIPSTAVMTDTDGRYVWTVQDGVVGKNYIKVGGYSGQGIIVSEGLSEDMFVVIEGARKVSTGMSVKTTE